MNEHIDILLLLDYAQGKISNDAQSDSITDHLCECEFCRQILKSHYYLIRNHEVLLEKFFPEVEAVVSEEIVNEITRQPEFQLSIAGVINSISDKIQTLKKQGEVVGKEIRTEVLRFLNEIKSFSNLEELMVPLKVESISLLGAADSGKFKDQNLKYLTHNIKLSFLPFKNFRIEDFKYEFTGKFFYVTYNNENFKDLKDRKVSLTTNIGAPFIFATTFKEAHTSVSARFKIGFEEILSGDESTSDNENNYEFFLSIE
jgi:hypothetical protein